MLILVGVTINFALNGGIISKSKQAAAAMQKAADLEELQLAVISAMDYTTGQVVRDDLVSSLSNGWQVTQSASYTCTSPSGNVFTVTADGQITVEGESSGGGNTSSEDLAYLRTYIGQNIFNLLGWDEVNETFTFNEPNMSLAPGQDASSTQDNNGNEMLVIQYKGNLYTLYFRGQNDNFTIVNVTEGAFPGFEDNIPEPGNNSSSSSSESSLQYVRLNNIDYIVFDEDTINETVDLISADALEVSNNNITLGYDDPNAIAAVPAVDENNPTKAEKLERVAWSYNNAVETLVTACKNATGLTIDGTDVISIRSVGNTNLKYTSNGITGSDSGTYTYDWQSIGASKDWFTTNGYDIYNLKAGDINYQSDYNKMTALEIALADNKQYYWFASRFVDENSYNVLFSIRYVNNSGSLDNECFCNSIRDGDIYCEHNIFDVRPIVTINSSLLDNISGTGTSADPYVIQ